MTQVATIADKQKIETETPISEQWAHRSLYEMLSSTASKFPDRPAVTFQIKSGAKDKAETYTWAELRSAVTKAANMFRKHGISDRDVVAYVLPICNEATITLLAGATAGIVNPINALLETDQIASILNETGAKAVVTLTPFPKTDVSARVAAAVAMAPNVKTIFEVDLKRYLGPPASWIVPLLRPKPTGGHNAKVVDFHTEMASAGGDALDFEETLDDRICAYFHTGGTTGMPKVAQHRASGIIYNGWCGHSYMFTEKDVLICPLPMFHVLGAYPVFMSCVSSGAHMVMPTPAGYRGDGVFDNFWKLIERWGVTFMVTVPTAAAALMQRAIDADVSSLRYALCGSAPLPVELFKKFEDATGVRILEGYGMTEATCLVAINPPHGERKVGSVGLPFPYTDVRILMCDEAGNITRECGTDEIGEICVANPGVVTGHTYTEQDKNKGLFADEKYLRTGDLGRIDPDGYLWITGRAKDLIIRGGHNIDPAVIEEALMGHADVAFAGAIGQPDAHSGELPCVYVELVDGATASIEDLATYADANISERAAHPKHVEILPELPKTAVGKVFKPDLRKRAITRVYNAALTDAGLDAEVENVFEDKKRGLVAAIRRNGEISDAQMTETLGGFARPWQWVD